MSALRPRSFTAVATIHPVVLERRISDALAVGLSALVPALIALGITVAFPEASLPLVLMAIAGVVAIVALMASSRLEFTVLLAVIYLGLLGGPFKLFFSGTREVSAAAQDLLILAICVGAVVRLVVSRETIKLPALSGWVIAWVALVVMNAFNPQTAGILHTLGGFRQLLQFVPFFFFGYLLIRSKRRFRQFFIIMGVIALANGAVAAYQTELSPSQVATWGPGYHNLIYIPEGSRGSGRTYVSEGEGRVRPPGLGSDEGFSGAVGHIALPLCLALFVTSRRRKWLAALLCVGSMVAVIVGLGRLQLVAAALGVVAFAALVVFSGRRVSRTLAALMAVVVLAIPAGALTVTLLRSGTFSRYEKIGTSSSTTLHREGLLTKIPKYIAASPFGFGLGTAGPVGSFGGASNDLIEGHGFSAETEYDLLVKELGGPGLILWCALMIYMIALIARGIRRVRDGDLAVDLAGTFAPFVVLPITATAAALTPSTASEPYFWFAIGVAAYWFAGPGREQLGSNVEGSDALLTAA